MAVKTKTTIEGQIALLQQLVSGTSKHFGTATSLKFASADHTPADVTSSLNELAALLQALVDARTAVKVKLAAVNAQAPALRTFEQAYEAFVQATFGESTDVLADFGLQPKKARTPLTTEQKTVANAKRQATREARGITSKKAKAAVTGGVIDVVTTTVKAGPPVVTSSATPSTPAASSGASTGNGASASSTAGGGATGGTTSHGA